MLFLGLHLNPSKRKERYSQLSTEAEMRLKSNLADEFEFYEFAVQRLQRQARELGLAGSLEEELGENRTWRKSNNWSFYIACTVVLYWSF